MRDRPSNRRLGIRFGGLIAVATLGLALPGCDSPTAADQGIFFDFNCRIPATMIFDGGVGVDGIPALNNPSFVEPWDPAASYLEDDDRVIGIEVDGEAYAIPHNILWWHEIVNMILPDGRAIAVTYCPLTGSSMVFDRSVVDDAQLRVSGFLFQNNLLMYDGQTERSLWPQMARSAECGPETGTVLPMIPALETTWVGWQGLHLDTKVVSGDLNFFRDYTAYPYSDYEELHILDLLTPMMNPIDERRPPKERVIGVPSRSGDGGLAFPFLELSKDGGTVVHSFTFEGVEMVLLWETHLAGGMVYLPEVDGQPLTFTDENNRIWDLETDSRWRIDGRAIDGPLIGSQLEPVPEAYVSFWFAWAGFHPETQIWTNGDEM